MLCYISNNHSLVNEPASRICPGMYFADRVAFHMVTTTISLFKIEPLEGQKIPDPTTIEYSPKAVQCVIIYSSVVGPSLIEPTLIGNHSDLDVSLLSGMRKHRTY
jgi:hypothetical protein